MMSTVFPYTMPCQVRQLALLEAGCQPWNSDTLACSPDAGRFAFAATLAVYVYEQARAGGQFQLVSVMAQHKKTVTSLAWHPTDADLFVSASLDPMLLVWNVRKQTALVQLSLPEPMQPRCAAFLPHSHGTVGFLDGAGPLLLWNYSGGAAAGPAVHKETQALASQVCLYRWHPAAAAAASASEASGRIALGHEDGTLSVVRPGKKTLRRVTFLEADEELDDDDDDESRDAVLGLEWDALSPNFLLVASRSAGLRLVDVDAQTTNLIFQLPSVAAPLAHSLAWMPGAPGLFVAGDSTTGVLRLFSVSRPGPVDSVRVKKSGFRNLRVLVPRTPTDPTSLDVSDASGGGVCGFGGHHSSPTSGSFAAAASSGYCLPDCLLLCAFLDGGVGLYDVQRRDWLFLREMGHVETVFDCEFSPRDENLLATGSFDGTVKLWSISGASGFAPVQSSPDGEGVIYSIAWSADGGRIAGATAKNGVFVFDLATGAIESRFTEHGQQPVYCVSWNAKPPYLLASASADCSCVVRDEAGRQVKRLAHPAAVYGVAWHQHTRDILATACEDKAVRVFYLTSASDRPTRMFTGHTSKVFGVRWSPLQDSYLCSGSDDCTIRVWDCTAEKSVAHLKGHTGPVRGLVWHPELAYLLVSGSWDCHIHCWDIRDGSCLAAVTDHRADIYGLAIHPRRPMLLASCSRDSTLRLWTLSELAGPLPACLLFRGLADACFLPAETAIRQPGQPAMSGTQSRRLLRDCAGGAGGGGGAGGATSSASADHLALLLQASPAAANLHDLQRALAGTPTAALGDSYGRSGGYVAAKDLLKFQAARAQQLELAAAAGSNSGRAVSRHRQLRDAAAAHLRGGNLRRYCELQAQLGRWEKALALAPGVSLAFWRELCQRYTASQRSLELDDLIAYAVATGNADSAAQMLSRHGKFADALLVSQAAHEGLFGEPEPVGGGGEAALASCGQRRVGSHPERLRSAWATLAECLFQRGAPVDAACCHLAIGDVDAAVAKLLRGNELDLALWLATRADCDQRLRDLAAEWSGWRLDRLPGLDPRRRAELLARLADLHSRRTDLLVAFACRFSGSAADIDSVHRQLGLPGLDACLEVAERLRASMPAAPEGGSCGGGPAPAELLRPRLDIIGHYLLSANPLAGLEFGLAAVRDILADRETPWTLASVEALVSLMSCARTGKLQQASAVQEKNELLFLATYLGALRAIRQGYHAVVAPLFRHARLHFERHKDCMGFGRHLTGALLDKELHAWKLMRRSRSEDKLPEEMRPVWRALIHKCAGETGLEPGEDMVAGSALPYHSDFDNCFFMEKRIRGPVFYLEDGRFTIGLNDACMWAKVNPFSPSLTGARINPF